MLSDRMYTRRNGAAGFTLVEVIVAMALVALIAAAIGGAFDISYRVVAPGQAQDRLAGAHDQQRFEQNLGQDLSRAACVKVGGSGTAYGSCFQGFASNAVVSAACGAAKLIVCVGWPDVAQSSCHIAAYTASNLVSVVGGTLDVTGLVKRQEYRVPFLGAKPDLTGSNVTTDMVALAVSVPAASGSLSVLNKPEGTYWWVRTLYATVTAVGTSKAPLSNTPAQPLTLHPLSTDPAGQSANITASGPPC